MEDEMVRSEVLPLSSPGSSLGTQPGQQTRERRSLDLWSESCTREIEVDSLRRSVRPVDGAMPSFSQFPLHIASSMGRTDLVRSIISQGHGVDAPNEYGCTSLHIAAESGLVPVARVLLTLGADTALRCHKGESAVDKAITGSNVEILTALVEHGADVNVADTGGSLPLHAAARLGHEAIVSVLCRKGGAAVDAWDSRGYTPLQIAVMGGHVGSTEALLASGAQVNLKGRERLMSALDRAVARNNVEIARVLIEYGAGGFSYLRSGSALLHVAAERGDADMVSLLCLQGGTTIDVLDRRGHTPLQRALIEGHTKVILILLASGADVALLQQRKIKSAVGLAVSREDVDVLTALIEHGADVNVADADGSTPLHTAAHRGHEAMVSVLCHIGGSDIDALDSRGYTPLHMAIMGGHLGSTNALLASGAKITLRDRECKRSAIDWAFARGHVEIVRALIEYGAEVDTSATNGSALLHAAAARGESEMVSLLCLQAGIAVDTLDRRGRTPLQRAHAGGHRAATLALLAAGADVGLLRPYGGTSAVGLAVSRGNVDVVTALAEHGAGINVADAGGSTPLHAAARLGHEAMVSVLCRIDGSDIDARDRRGYTPLHIAVMGGHLGSAKALLASGAKITLRDRERKWSTLDWAFGCGHVEIARALIEYGAEVDTSATNGSALLHAAAARGESEMVSLLCLQAGIAVDTLDRRGRTPLQRAHAGGHRAATLALLAAGADVGLLRPYGGTSAVGLAVSRGNVDVLTALAEHGADVNVADTDGSTPLHAAARLGHEAMVSVLCRKRRATVDARDRRGYTPLHIAVMGGHLESTNALLASGAKITLRDRECKRSAIDWAVARGHVEIVRALIEYGAEVDTSATNGSALLHAAAARGESEMVSLLCLQAGIAVDTLDRQGRTPLQRAHAGGHRAATLALLAAGADVGLLRPYGGTSAVGLAVSRGNVDVVTALAEHGADVNVADTGGSTPLHAAARLGHEAMVSVLCRKRRATVDARDRRGYTPLHIAVMGGHLESAEVLLASGAQVTLQAGECQKSTLFLAVARGHVEIAKTLMKYGAEVSTAAANGLTPLHIAVDNGDTEMVSLLCLHGGITVDALDRRGRTPLQRAHAGGHRAATLALLAAGADVGLLRPYDGTSAVGLAVSRGDVDVLTALVKHGAGINVADADGSTPLHAAARLGHEAMVSVLCRIGGSDIDARDRRGYTPLHIAVMGGHLESAEALLASGATVNLRDRERKRSEIDWAVARGHVEIARALIEYGATANSAGLDGRTLLHVAAASGDSEMVSLLCLYVGAAIDRRDRHGTTPLFNAVQAGHDAAALALLASGANVALRCHDLSGLDLAAKMGDTHMARTFLKHGADVNAASRTGVTPLHLAAAVEEHELIDMFAEAGANVEQVDDNGDTPLHVAAQHACVEAVAALLEQGAGASKQNTAGFTPLHVAAAQAGKIGSADVVDVLLRWGADEHATNVDGHKAIDVVGSRPGFDEYDALLMAEVVGDFQSPKDLWRVRELLTNATVDKAWRRRGFLVMCRAHFLSRRVQAGGLSAYPDAVVAKRIRRNSEPSKSDVDWTILARMMMGCGTDPISHKGSGADPIFRAIVAFL